ncbi:MAG TPA: GntR family transcriptional regulator [Candidatus Dorea intestinavium]|nr:GntR family transcriptional regulator [Candidatus Dorea intestinavium]
MTHFHYRTLRENVVDAIRQKILNHELKPGMRIIEQDIAEEFGVSRGPIREAFRQLEQEGIVEYTRNVGCSVKSITLEDVFEVYTLRGTYELIAIKSFKGNIPKTVLKRMEKILDSMKHMNEDNFNDVITYDNLFHSVIIEETHMPRLMKAWSDLDYATILSCFIEIEDSKTVAGWQYKIHNELYEVYKSGDSNKICEIVTNHYMGSITRKLRDNNLSAEEFKFPVDLLKTFI